MADEIKKIPVKKFYVTFNFDSKLGVATGCKISPASPVVVEESFTDKENEAPKVNKDEDLDFQDVFRLFVSVMSLYLKYIPISMNFVPLLHSMVAWKKLEDFSKSKGLERADISGDTSKTYELDVSFYRESKYYFDEACSAAEGLTHFPEVMLIGLVSAYDALLSKLLRVVFSTREETIFTSDKSIKFSELLKFDSIEAARNSIVDKEIETILRSSHSEQFLSMQQRFSMELKKGLKVWPAFVELCERRNLLTHTGGIVSSQYIANCVENKCDVSGVSVGSKLKVDPTYFSRSVNVIYEIGIKLIYVLWRKFKKEENDKADKSLNEVCFNLIYSHSYALAESLLLFGIDTVSRYKGSDNLKRYMTINLANAVRLQKREDEARSIIDGEDWTAASDILKIGAAAVRGNIDEVVELMKIIGNNKNPDAEEYRTWPVFWTVKAHPKFIETFEYIFGEPLVVQSSAVASPPEDATGDEIIAVTKH